jgi:transposase-like protein
MTQIDDPLPCGHAPIHRCGVQYQGTPEDWDGVSEWRCMECGRRWGRWTGRELTSRSDIEPRYGIRRGVAPRAPESQD